MMLAALKMFVEIFLKKSEFNLFVRKIYSEDLTHRFPFKDGNKQLRL